MTEQFTADDFLANYGDSARILFMNHPEKGLMPVSSDDAQHLTADTKIYAMVPADVIKPKEE